ncbi:MAG: GTP-binding protein [Candidatus Lokiarchaeota archaeon]|nr:GTP-binding protein [Candidatus Lokiarchaeota archaeon]
MIIITKKYIFKVLVAGAGGVGKTTLLHRVVHGKFIEDTKITIGVEFFLLNMPVNSVECSLQLWDFGGQERFRFMLDSYVMGAKGALLLYDLTRMKTLDKLQEWVGICRRHDPNLPILFVGTKLDRVEDISVPDDYAQEFLEPLNLFEHIKISSKTGENIMGAFEIIVKRILELQGIH